MRWRTRAKDNRWRSLVREFSYNFVFFFVTYRVRNYVNIIISRWSRSKFLSRIDNRRLLLLQGSQCRPFLLVSSQLSSSRIYQIPLLTRIRFSTIYNTLPPNAQRILVEKHLAQLLDSLSSETANHGAQFYLIRPSSEIMIYSSCLQGYRTSVTSSYCSCS